MLAAIAQHEDKTKTNTAQLLLISAIHQVHASILTDEVFTDDDVFLTTDVSFVNS